MTRAVKLGMAIKDGRLVSIGSVSLGSACGCVCPKCGEPVVAKNRDFEGRVTQIHFAHAKDSDCAERGGETAPETALHLLAKEIVTDGLRVMIPGLQGFPEAKQAEFRWSFPAKRITFQQAFKEPWRPAVQSGQDMRPDVVGVTEKRQEIHIEFKVAHPVPPEKSEAALREGRWMLEIDLARFRGAPINVSELRTFIQQNVADRAWLSHGPGFDLKERLYRASDTPVKCPLQLPRAIESGTCKSCPCRLSSPMTIRPLAVRCTGKSKVTSKAALSAWEKGGVLNIPGFASAILAAHHRAEQAAAARKTQIAELRSRILELDHGRAGREADGNRLRSLVETVVAVEGRIKAERRRLEGVARAIDTAAAVRSNRAKELLRAKQSALEPAQVRLQQLREAEITKGRERHFRQAVMTDYQAGKRPVLCPHCRQPAKGRFNKDGGLALIEKCECLVPIHERTPNPTVWAAERSRRFVEDRIKDL